LISAIYFFKSLSFSFLEATESIDKINLKNRQIS